MILKVEASEGALAGAEAKEAGVVAAVEAMMMMMMMVFVRFPNQKDSSKLCELITFERLEVDSNDTAGHFPFPFATTKDNPPAHASTFHPHYNTMASLSSGFLGAEARANAGTAFESALEDLKIKYEKIEEQKQKEAAAEVTLRHSQRAFRHTLTRSPLPWQHHPTHEHPTGSGSKGGSCQGKA